MQKIIIVSFAVLMFVGLATASKSCATLAEFDCLTSNECYFDYTQESCQLLKIDSQKVQDLKNFRVLQTEESSAATTGASESGEEGSTASTAKSTAAGSSAANSTASTVKASQSPLLSVLITAALFVAGVFFI